QVREPGPLVPPGTRAVVAEKVRALARQASIVVMSGSLPPGLESDVYRELVAIVRAQQVPVILDASGEPLALGLEARPWLIKPNLEELADLARRLGIEAGAAGPAALLSQATGTHPPPAEAETVRRWAAAVARHVHERFQVRVVASLGPLGAVVVDRGEAYAVVPPPVTAVNTISCGDALVAGIAVAWTRGQDLTKAVRLGVAAATAKARIFSTGQLHPADVAQLLSQVETHAIAGN
ncbi:MAG: PfkB family carbohydrate kinase, partial [Bacillota bacterium]